jgi:centrosomal protein CEP104
MPGKVPFHVVHSSGQDENCKASELNRHTPMTKGWQSNKYVAVNGITSYYGVVYYFAFYVAVSNVRLCAMLRFCVYPQDIVIQLEKRARVRKIQILSHQYLIRKFQINCLVLLCEISVY